MAQLRVVSNPRPDMVSGGDALIKVDVPAGVAARDVRVTLNDADVTAAFRADAAGRALTGLVTGLVNGPNALAATVNGKPGARLTVVNHPNIGPVFAGPHEQPFICETQNFKLPSGGTLGPALDANCSIATRVDYFYRTTAGGALKPLPDPKAAPADVATVTTTTGQAVPYIVRVETGTINRAIYQIAMLHNPARDATPDFMTRPAGWNGRLIYTFGGGCTTGWYRQGATTGGVDDDVMLRQGYAVASASLNTFGNNCAEVLAAETMMMVKEHFIEAYGAPAVHDRLGRLGRFVPAAPDRRQLSGTARRHHARAQLSRPRLRHGPVHHRRAAVAALLRHARDAAVSPTSRSDRSPASATSRR